MFNPKYISAHQFLEPIKGTPHESELNTEAHAIFYCVLGDYNTVFWLNRLEYFKFLPYLIFLKEYPLILGGNFYIGNFAAKQQTFAWYLADLF